jgi:hypothetical protein
MWMHAPFEEQVGMAVVEQRGMGMIGKRFLRVELQQMNASRLRRLAKACKQ